MSVALDAITNQIKKWAATPQPLSPVPNNPQPRVQVQPKKNDFLSNVGRFAGNALTSVINQTPLKYIPKPINLPTQNISNTVLKFGADSALSILNTGPNAAQGARDIATNLRSNTTTPMNFLANLAPIAEAGLTIGTGGAAKGVLTSTKPALKKIGEGVFKGAAGGGSFGFLQGLKEGKSAPDLRTQFQGTIAPTLAGAAFGGALGGAAPAAGVVVRQGKDTFQKNVASHFADTISSKTLSPQSSPIIQRYFDALNVDKKIEKPLIKAINTFAEGKLDDVDSNAVLRAATEELLPQLRREPTPELAKIWRYIIERKSGLVPKEVPYAIRDLDQAVADFSGKTVAQAGFIGMKKKVEPVNPFNKKYAFNINKNKLGITETAKANLDDTVIGIKTELQEIKGRPLSQDEILNDAKASEILRKVVDREQTKEFAAALTKLRQQVAAEASGKGISKDFIENLRVLSSVAGDTGRRLKSFDVIVDPDTTSIKEDLVKNLIKLGHNADDLIKAAEGVDFTNQKQVTKFYRQFVKPTLGEKISEYRYINLLSSPKTHIVNAFSNLIQGSVVSPATKLASGTVDLVASALTGKERSHYIAEVPAYYRGALSSVGEAVVKFSKAMSGNSIIERPDISKIPTGSKVLAPFQAIPRLLNASDEFFRTIVKGGEREALVTKYVKMSKELGPEMLERIADEKAKYFIFRGPVDPTNSSGQGALLSGIDNITANIYRLRDVPGVGWFIPFVQTPMNILKQGIEYSPAGFATIKGAKDPTEQIGKALIGSTVFSGAGWLAMNNRTTWDVPKDKTAREQFYAAGMQPYSIKIGDKWVSYSKIGPLAYPIAMAAAIKHVYKDDPKSLSSSQLDKVGQIVGTLGNFFSDQSYLEGISNLIEFVSPEEGFQDYSATIQKNIGGLGSQLVPLSSLQRWVTTILDPVYRKGTNLEENITKGIPVLSENAPYYKDPQGQPSTRQFPLVNAFSPASITEEKPRAATLYQRRQLKLQKNSLAKKRKEERSK